MKNATDMENQVFQKVQTQEEYRAMISKIMNHMQSKWIDLVDIFDHQNIIY